MKLIEYGFLITFIISLILTSFLLLPKFLPEKLPLFYSLPWGGSQLANKEQFLIIPALCLSIGLVNLLISRQLHSQQTLLKRFLQISSTVCGVVLILSLARIIMIFL